MDLIIPSGSKRNIILMRSEAFTDFCCIISTYNNRQISTKVPLLSLLKPSSMQSDVWIREPYVERTGIAARGLHITGSFFLRRS
jgi:hypothetical protein